jgi:hypothetical protein
VKLLLHVVPRARRGAWKQRAHSTQHTAHSTQHTAHSAADLPRTIANAKPGEIMRPTADACPLDGPQAPSLGLQTRCPAAQSVEGKRGAGEKRWVAGLDLERTSRNDISMVSKGTLSTLGAAVGGVVAANGRPWSQRGCATRPRG